jgi:hypothetical protein
LRPFQPYVERSEAMGENSFVIKNSPLDRIREMFTSRINLLCIEDNLELCSLLCEDFFRSPIFHNKTANTFETAKNAIFSKVRYHCWILDLTLEHHNDALELLKIKQKFPFCIVISGARSLFDATMAIREGAYGAYDKVTLFTGNPHEFIKEMCALAVLSFLLNAKKPERLDIFFLLLKKHIQTPEEWSLAYCLNERSVRDICEENSGLTTKQFLPFYHALNAIIFSDCIIDGMAGSGEAVAQLKSKKAFYEQCAEFVIYHMDTIFGPRFLQQSSLEK